MSLSVNDRNQLLEIAQMAYGHGRGEGMKGGEGRIGMIGDRVVKFNTHRGERLCGPKANADMRASCNALRAQLLKIADGYQLASKQHAAIRHELGLTKNGRDTGSKTLLNRKVVARVIDMIAAGAGEKVKKGGHSEIWKDVDRSDKMRSASDMTFETVNDRVAEENLFNLDTKNYDGRGAVTITGNRDALSDMPDLAAIEEKVLKDPVGLHKAHVNMATGMCKMALMREMYIGATKGFEKMQFGKDVVRGGQWEYRLLLPDGKELGGDVSVESACDQLAQAVTGNPEAKYDTLSPKERAKVHIVFSLLNQSGQQATSVSYGFLFGSGHSPKGDGRFVALHTGDKFVHRLERSPDGGLTISMAHRKLKVGLMSFRHPKDDAEYDLEDDQASMFGKIEVKISGAEVERLSQLDWSKIDGDGLLEYEGVHGDDAFFYEEGLPACFKEVGIDEQYVPQLEVSCATLLNIELN